MKDCDDGCDSYNVPATILDGEALSDVMDYRAYSSGIVHMPSAWTAADIAFVVSPTVDGTYQPLRDINGDIVQITGPAVDQSYDLPSLLAPARFFKLWSQNGVISVLQGDDRTLLLDLKSCNPGTDGNTVTLGAGSELIGLVQPFDAMLEGGLTELIGVDEQVDQDEYSASVGVALAGTYSGEILGVTLYTTEDDSGAILEPTGQLIFLDADPAIAAGDAAMTAAERVTVIGHIDVTADDWQADASGASANIKNQPLTFHALGTLYAVWFHTFATSFNDGADDDEQLEFNFWFRRDS